MLKITIENALLAAADIFQKKVVLNICVFLRNFFCHYTRCRQNDYFNILASYPVSRLIGFSVSLCNFPVFRWGLGSTKVSKSCYLE